MAKGSKLKAPHVAEELQRLVRQETQTAYLIGAHLARLQDRFDEIEACVSFGEFVERTFDIPFDRAEQLIRIHRKTEECGISLDDLAGIHWTKFRAVTAALTPETKDQWLDVARKWSVRSKWKYHSVRNLRADLGTVGVVASEGQAA